MKNEQLKVIEELFVSKFKNKGWELFENRIAHPGGLGLIEYGAKISDLAKLNMLKFFSPDEKESVCLSWTDFPNNDNSIDCFVQLNFGFSQITTEDFEVLVLVINAIYNK